MHLKSHDGEGVLRLMSPVPMKSDSDDETGYLLDILSIGLLDRDGAKKLKPLLQRDLQTEKQDSDRHRRLAVSKSFG